MVTNVLLRGRSLTEFETLDSPDIVFLVNDMDREIEEVNGLKEYLLDKEINLVFNMVLGAEIGYKRINNQVMKVQLGKNKFNKGMLGSIIQVKP